MRHRMLVAAAATLAGLSAVPFAASSGRPLPAPRSSRKAPHPLPANNTSWRSLKRAVNTGALIPAEPSIKAKLRHKWFRKQIAFAALRCQVGQELPSDRDLLAEVKKHRQSAA